VRLVLDPAAELDDYAISDVQGMVVVKAAIYAQLVAWLDSGGFGWHGLAMIPRH
jgi:hypothetical protein